jgi:hypothetical protein
MLCYAMLCYAMLCYAMLRHYKSFIHTTSLASTQHATQDLNLALCRLAWGEASVIRPLSCKVGMPQVLLTLWWMARQNINLCTPTKVSSKGKSKPIITPLVLPLHI